MSGRWFRWLIPFWAVIGLNSPALAQDAGFELEDFDFWAEQCLLLSQDTDYEKTLEACETAISLKRKRDNLELWSARSRALFELGQYVDAIGSYNRVLEVAPRESIALAYQCASYVQLSRLDDAIAACEQALAINGNWGTDSPALAWYYHGLALQTMGRLETALGSYGRALRMDPENVMARAGQCAVAAELGYNDGYGNSYQGCTLSESVIAYEQALAQQPDAVTIWFQQGLALEQLGRYAQALTSYEQAVALVEDHSLALAHQCGVLNQLEEFETALAACDAALKGNDKWDRLGPSYAWSQRSAAQIGLEDYEAALASAERAIALRPDYSGGWNNKAVSLWHLEELVQAAGAIEMAYLREQKVLEQLGQTFERTYSEPRILFYRRSIVTAFNQGSILLDLEQYDSAIDAYRRAETDLEKWSSQLLGITLVNDNFLAQLWMRFAIALQSNGLSNLFSLESPISYAYRATEHLPESFEAWYTLSTIQISNGFYSDALVSLEQATALDSEYPDLATAWQHLGNLAVTLGNYDGAQQAFDMANMLAPDSVDTASIWYDIGVASLEEGAYSYAWDALQQAAIADPENIDIAIQQGLVLNQAGCSTIALQFFELLTNLDPSNANVSQHYEKLLSMESNGLNESIAESSDSRFVNRSTVTIDDRSCPQIF
ncbi:MAG: tetratricopeptide repeat protein [Leptolyngbyaceae cyanobacterium MAG.088]|nr:tetratricopeptide repeat protein [Leptolyngbyaceae cyanobacterium MAG.088]